MHSPPARFRPGAARVRFVISTVSACRAAHARPRGRSAMSRGWRCGLSLLLVIGLLVVAGLEAQAQAPKKGGVLKVAVLGDPPTLDSHWTTANFVEVITQHIYESLYTLDQN